MVLFVIIVGACSLHAAHNILRYDRLPLIQGIRIFDHLKITVDDHHSAIVNIGHLRQTCIDNFGRTFLQIVIACQLIT